MLTTTTRQNRCTTDETILLDAACMAMAMASNLASAICSTEKP